MSNSASRAVVCSRVTTPVEAIGDDTPNCVDASFVFSTNWRVMPSRCRADSSSRPLSFDRLFTSSSHFIFRARKSCTDFWLIATFRSSCGARGKLGEGVSNTSDRKQHSTSASWSAIVVFSSSVSSNVLPSNESTMPSCWNTAKKDAAWWVH